MPDRHLLRAPRRAQPVDPLTAAAKLFAGEQQAAKSRLRDLFGYRTWQEEAWAFYDNLGEFTWSVDWLGKALSRVRLLAAQQAGGGDEPVPIDEGPAAEAVARLGAGIGGHSQLLYQATINLSVPGEGWLVGEINAVGVENWRIYSTSEIRESSHSGSQFEVLVDTNLWRPLDPESYVTRLWNPHPRLQHQGTSQAQAALPIMRRIDLLDRRIVASLVSRLAMNGIMLIPSEGTFNVPAKYQEAADPFVSYLIDIASNNIKNPGNASAAIPMPIKFSSELIDKWKHLTFGDGITSELLEERDKELRRLATAVNVPAEVVLGLGNVNHWSAWQLEESAIKMHVSPMAEVIVNALTVGYLHPLLAAQGADLYGEDGGTLVVWYDTSELTSRPDKTDPAFRAYDRFELSGAALRRETGFNECDAPEAEELREQILKRMATSIQLGPLALGQLTNTTIDTPQPPEDGSAGGPERASPDAQPAAGPSSGQPRQRGAPDTRGEPPPPPGPHAAALAHLLGGYITPDAEPRQPVGAAPAHASNGQHRSSGGDQ